MSKKNPRKGASRGGAGGTGRSFAPYVVAGAAALAVVAVLGFIVAGQFTQNDEKVPERVVTAPGRFLGDASAPVKVIEYADFQCPYCKKAEVDVVSKFTEEYVDTGKASLEFRNLAFLGDESVLAAEASLCAEDQEKFWEYHDALFDAQGAENSGAFSPDRLVELAEDVGLDTAMFEECMTNETHRQEVLDEREEANNAGISSTPYFFVNDVAVKGVRSYSEFKEVVEAELAKASGGGQ